MTFFPEVPHQKWIAVRAKGRGVSHFSPAAPGQPHFEIFPLFFSSLNVFYVIASTLL
jgi:hypothetical protein